MDGILAYGRCKQFTDGAFVRPGRIGGANELAEIRYRVVFFQNGRDDGTAAHKAYQLAIKGTLTVYCIKFPCLASRQLGELKGHDTKAAFNDLVKNGSGMSFGKGVRLDHGKSSIAHIFVMIFGEQR